MVQLKRASRAWSMTFEQYNIKSGQLQWTCVVISGSMLGGFVFSWTYRLKARPEKETSTIYLRTCIPMSHSVFHVLLIQFEFFLELQSLTT